MKRSILILTAAFLLLTACQPKPATAHEIAVELATIQAAAFTPVVVSTPTYQPIPTFTPISSPIPAIETNTAAPATPTIMAVTATSTPTGYHITADNVCVAGGGNLGVDGGIEMIWVEDVTSFDAGLHYQHPWKDISNISQFNSITLTPSWEGNNDTLQFKFCKVDGVWKGWMILRNGEFAFYDGISFTQRTSQSTMDIYQHDVAGRGSGKYAAYGNLYTISEMRNLPGAQEISIQLEKAEYWMISIDAGSVYLPFSYESWTSKQWVLEVFKK